MIRYALAAALACAAGPAMAQTLRMGVGAQVTSVDPHYHNISPNSAFATTIFDTLLEMDPRVRPIPHLATAWRAVAPDAWEITLREGVRFHNGSAFTAEDVAFTVERVRGVQNSPGSYATYLTSIRAIEILGPHRLRILTHAPDPLMPVNLAMVPMLDRETHHGATTEQFNSGQLAIGTGPYRLFSHQSGDRMELERNDAWFGPKPHWQRVSYRMITNDPARTAALLAGDVDIIDQVPTSDMERLAKDERIRLSRADSLRLVYFFLDRSRIGANPFVTDNDGKPLERNPFEDIRVRQALSLAIDRQAIVSRVMEGAARATAQFMPPGAFGHVPELEPPPRADLDQARRLLAEAGFPQGFRLTLHGPNDRYPNDARIVQAVGQMWTRVGVRTQVEVAPYASFVTRASRQEFAAFLVSWGSSTGEPSAGLRSVLATWNRERGLGAVNRARYSNPAFDRGLAAAMQELDDGRREAMLRDVTRLAMDDVGMIPTHLQVNVWAMRRGFRHEARTDERTRPQDVRPAQD